MQKKTLVLLMASSFAILAAHTATAGNRAGAVTITPGVGSYVFSPKRSLNTAAVLPTVALAYNFDERWAIEAGYGNLDTTYRSSNIPGSVSGNLYTVAGLYRLGTYNMLEPYVSLGTGILYLNPNGTSSTNQANLNAALGTQVFFGDSIALRGEVRDLYMTAGGKNDLMFNFGVSFLLGGNKAEAPHVSYKGEDFK